MSLDMSDLSWSLAVGGGFAFFTSFGIGANDVANAFASSVGSGAVSYQKAVYIAAVFEFCGAVFLGSHVTGTIRKGIADLDQFCETPQQLLIGMLSVIFCTGIWLILATHYELPVSTTHSCVGGVIGIAVTAKGWGAVHWSGVGSIVASWIISPLLTGLLGAGLFVFVRNSIMRKPDAKDRAFQFYPPMAAVTIFLNLFLIVYHGTGATQELSLASATAVSLVPGVLAALVIQFVMLPKLRAEADDAAQQVGGGEQIGDSYTTESPASGDSDRNSNDSLALPSDSEGQRPVDETPDRDGSVALPSDAESPVDETPEGNAKRESESRAANAELFDPSAEWVFRYLQVFTACFMSLAHGANDVANSIGPYAAVVALYTTCSRYAHTDWCTQTFGPANYDPVTHSCRCDPGYYFNGSTFIYPFETGVAGEFSYQFYSYSGSSSGSCGDVEPAKNLPAQDGAKCIPLRIKDGTTSINLRGLDYGKALGMIQGEFLAPVPSSGFDGSAPVVCTSSSTPVPEWIFVLGGLGIVAGLALYGRKILIAMGVKMTKITPSRGFAIDISSAFIVVVGSRIGLPLSTTHCKVGATVGVGLCEGKKGSVNTEFIYKIVVGWVVTLAITGGCSAVMFYVLMWALGAPL